jgi:hypothetical protein
MTTTFLRFTDEAAFTTALTEAGFTGLLSHTHIFDVIGTITQGGEWDPETSEEITPPTVLDGWHVNARLDELPIGWEAYVVTPDSPVRIFAGD